jgi:hypothetical protein
MQREQHDVITFLQEENRVLRAQLRGRRLQLSDHERRRLAELSARTIGTFSRELSAHRRTAVTLRR